MLLYFDFVNPSYTQVTKEQAISIIMNEVVGGNILDYNVYLNKEMCQKEIFDLTPYDQIVNPYENSWLFFIDQMPEYGWGHSCKYIFIQESTGNYLIFNKSIPPLNYWLCWEEISIQYPHQVVVQSTDTAFQLSSEYLLDPHKYAMLITFDAWDDTARWNNLSHLYTGLKEAYGFIDDNIFVLSGDGNFNPLIMNLNLDGLYPFNDFDGPCTKEKIAEIFEHLDTTMTIKDMFLFYATTHGDITGVGQDTTSLRLDNSQPLFDYELAEMVEDLNCSEMIFMMDICNGGGMVDDLEGPHRIIQVPVPWGSASWRGWKYFDFFTYGWATAVRGFHPGSITEPWIQGDSIGKHPDLSLVYPYWDMPDTLPDLYSFHGNGDGYIQFGEVFNYLKYLDAEADSLGIEYQNHGFQGDLLTLNGIEGRVDTSQYISGSFLIGRKLTLSPGIVLYDNSTYQNQCNLFLNDSTEILVEENAALNINGIFTQLTGCAGQSTLNIEGNISQDHMNFGANPGATININFLNPSKKYALNYFNFENVSVHAACDSLSFYISNFDHSPFEFTGSRLVLNNTNSFIDSPLEFYGNSLKIMNINEFENSFLDLSSGSVYIEESNDFINSGIKFSGYNLIISSLNDFTNSSLELSNGNIIINDENEFENSTITISHPVDDAGFIEISNNSFDNDTTVTSNSVITIEDYRNFQVDSNTFVYDAGRGIELYNAGWDGRGLQQIHNNSIELSQPSNSLWNDVGIHAYFSNVEIKNNQILKNSYGLVGFHNSDLNVLGDSTAEDISETQLIGDNTRCQCLFNVASFPIEFLWNVIRDTILYAPQYHSFIKTVEYDEFKQDTTVVPDWRGNPYLDVINNCWKNDTNPGDDRLIPLSAYLWRAPWCPGNGGHLKTEDITKTMYYHAQADISAGNFTEAETGFKQIIADYSDNKYALASLKGLFALNPAIYNSDYSSLKSFCNSLVLNPGDSILGKSAEWFSIRCNIENKNYQPAVNSLDSILNNPGTYTDSVFALIDLSEVFADMGDSTALKSSLVTRNPQLIPSSYQEFLLQRKDWIDLLLKPLKVNSNDKINPSSRNEPRSPAVIKSIYPNPIKDQFTIDCELFNDGNLEILLATTTGQQVAYFNLGKKFPGNYRETLFLPTDRKGILLLALRLDGAVVDSEKIICLE